MASRRRRFRPRRSEAQPAPAAPPRPAGGVSLLAVLLILLVGYWLGRFATFFPADALPLLDIGAALLCAVLFAVWYRRRAKRYLEARQAAERQAAAREDRAAAGEDATE